MLTNANGHRLAPLKWQRFLLFSELALVFLLVGCGRRPMSGQPEQAVVNLRIESDGDLIAYRLGTLTCPTGALVHLTFHHAGRFLSARHDWMLIYPDSLEALSEELLRNSGDFAKDDPRIIAVTPLADKGETVTTRFVAPPPGDYPFLCSTHPEDMRGILHVTK